MVTCGLWLMSLVCHGAVAQAHPFGDRYAAQQLEVDVHPDQVVVTLTLDVPDPLLAEEAGTDVVPGEVLADRLLHGVTLTVDGEPTQLVELSRDVRKDLIDMHATVIQLRWRAMADLRGEHTLRVGNANLGNTPGWFRDEVRIGGGAEVTASNLVVWRHGTPSWKTSAWSRSEGLRRVDLSIRTPSTPWLQLAQRWSPTWWSLPQAWERPVPRAWRTGRTQAATVAIALVVAGLLGLFASCRATPWRSPLFLGFGVAAMAWGGISAPVAGTLIAAAALLLALDRAFAGFALALTLPWVFAVATPDWWMLLGTAWLVGATLGRVAPLPDPVRVYTLAGLAMVAVTRGAAW